MVTENNGRLIKYFIFPTLLINLLIMGAVPEYRTAGSIYLIFSLVGLVFYYLPPFQESLIGVKKEVFLGIGQGVAGAIAFMVIQRIIPSFSLGLPSVPLALVDSVKFVIIVYIAPTVQEYVFRGALLGALRDNDLYKLSFWKANFTQAGLFSLEHLVAYGIFLGQLATLTELYGAFAAVVGLFVAAFLFGLFAGWLANKTGSLLPSIVSHMIINGLLWSAGFVIYA